MDNKQVSYRQLELLLDFMEQHRALALGRVRGKEGNAVSQQLWQKCSAILNAEFNGARKTVPEWKKYYNQYKSRIKAKNALIMNGGGPGTPTALTPLEERLCSILGRCSSPLSVCQKEEAGAMHDEQDSMYGDSTSNDWKIMETHTETNNPGVYVTIENEVIDVTPTITNGRTASTASNDDNENGDFPHVSRQEPQSHRVYTEPHKRSHRARLHGLKATSEFKAASNRLTRLVESRLKVDRAMVCAINRQAAAFEGLADELRKFTSMYAQNMVEKKMAKQEQ